MILSFHFHTMLIIYTSYSQRYRTVILLKLFNTTKVNPANLTPEQKAKAKRLDTKISELVATKPIDVFQGKTECVHQCQDCKHCTCKIESFMDLSLPVLSEKVRQKVNICRITGFVCWYFNF